MEAALELIWSHSYGTTSVDAICEKAGVKKGSFYHFFESKSDLAVSALESDWQAKRSCFDTMFSPVAAPLERLGGYFDFILERQTSVQKECGCVLGCPIFSLGCEVSTQDEAIRAKVREILDRNIKYFESAIREANALGQINAPNPAAKARMVFALYQGTLTQAKIQNSVEPLRELKAGVFELLGVTSAEPASATS
jgi:TetR/AcrR family transcriptional repressor of nem operon